MLCELFLLWKIAEVGVHQYRNQILLEMQVE